MSLRPSSSSMSRPGTSSGGRRNFDSVSGTSSLLSTAESCSMTLQREIASDSLMQIINREKNFTVSQIMVFAEKGRVKQIMKSVEKYPDILSSTGTGGFTALHHACRGGHITLVEKLLSLEHYCSDLKDMESDISINAQTDSGETALHIAAYSNRMHVVDVLLRHRGININAVNSENQTALFYAVQRNNIEMVEQLLLKGIDHTIQDDIGDKAIDHSTSKECTAAFSLVEAKNMRSLLRNGGSNSFRKNDVVDLTARLSDELLIHIHSYLGHRDREYWWTVNKLFRTIFIAHKRTKPSQQRTISPNNVNTQNTTNTNNEVHKTRSKLSGAIKHDKQLNVDGSLPEAPSSQTGSSSHSGSGKPPFDPGYQSQRK